MGKRSGIQLCYPFEEKRLTRWNPPYIIQPKLDGERCRAVYDEEFGWTLISSELNTFNSVPHINQSLLFSNIPPSVELDGELYVHGSPFEEIHSMVSRTKNLHPNYHAVEYHVFDIVNINLPQWERLRVLRKLQERFHPGLCMVDIHLAEDLDGVLKAYDAILEKGYEGIIVRQLDAPYIRRRSIWVMKFKPKKSDTYKIIGFKQMIDKDGKPKEMLGSLSCKSLDTDEEFSFSAGMNNDFRSKYWPEDRAEELVGKYVLVKYQHLTSRGVPKGVMDFDILDNYDEPKYFNPLL